MKTIGIEIESSKAVFFALSKESTLITNITGNFKSLVISDIYDNSEIRNYQSTIFTFFDHLNPSYIAIVKRNHSGQQAASPISFKIEGIIQCYLQKEIEFVHPATINAFYKRHDFPIVVDYKYQTKAAQLAYFLLER
ncbi:MAG: DUF3010 family protein [bacterium]